MSIILGINAFHGDSSSCLVNNGVLVSAAEEERFRRIKHWAGFPTLSIKYCLENSGIDLSQVDIIAINSNPHANINKKVMKALRGKAGIKFLADRIKNYSKKSDFESYLRSEFKSDQFLGEIRYVEHHLSHLASSHLVSPYDQSISLSIDGLGDFVSTAWGGRR